jgi:hypothetical protein
MPEERRDASYRFTEADRRKLRGWEDILKPEPDQILPLQSLVPPEERPPLAADRLANTRSLAAKVLAKIRELEQKIDERCDRFSASSDQGRGSPLFQAMVRVFNERTTTVTYGHYKRALLLRQKLAEEDARSLKLQ